LQTKDSEIKDFDIIASHVIEDSCKNTLTQSLINQNAILRHQFVTTDKVLKPFEEIASNLSKDKTLDIQEVKDNTIINNNMKQSKLNSISLSYYKKQYLKDMLEILKSLNKDPDYPVVITKLEIVNKNDSLNLQDEVSVQFLDKKGKRHSFTVFMPKLSQDGYLYYNGSKKFITKQATLLPVIKESNERVQITTNYKKSFLYRKGEKINVTVDKALRLLLNKN
jgi:hypothetical protein